MRAHEKLTVFLELELVIRARGAIVLDEQERFFKLRLLNLGLTQKLTLNKQIENLKWHKEKQARKQSPQQAAEERNKLSPRYSRTSIPKNVWKT